MSQEEAVTVAAGAFEVKAALAEARANLERANPESARRHRDACRFLPGGNTRSVLFYPPFPLTMALGEGARLWDVDGHAYLDFCGEHSAGIYGHSHPVIREAIEQALSRGIVLSANNEYEPRLAEAICTRFPSIDLVRFCNSGTEANLMALSTARAATGRDAILVFEGAYHGSVLTFKSPPAPVNAPFPVVVAPYNDTEAALATIGREADRLAAVIVEPMLFSGGCIPGHPEFLTALRKETERRGILLIFDEIVTSRLSPSGRQGLLGIVPDLTTLGKYYGGGLSFGAFGGRRDLMERFDPRTVGALPHAGTFNNNVCSMAAGWAGLTQVLTPETLARLNEAGEDLRQRLGASAARLGLPLQFTGLGSLLQVHFRAEPVDRPAAPGEVRPALASLLHLDLIRRGIFASPRGLFTLSLPMSGEDLATLVWAIEEVVAERRHLISAAAAA